MMKGSVHLEMNETPHFFSCMTNMTQFFDEMGSRKMKAAQVYLLTNHHKINDSVEPRQLRYNL
jgi:hypothetical protein